MAPKKRIYTEEERLRRKAIVLEAMKWLELNQTDFSRRFGISQSTMSRILGDLVVANDAIIDTCKLVIRCFEAGREDLVYDVLGRDHQSPKVIKSDDGNILIKAPGVSPGLAQKVMAFLATELLEGDDAPDEWTAEALDLIDKTRNVLLRAEHERKQRAGESEDSAKDVG